MEFDFFTMDFASVVLSISICCILTLVVYLISAFGTKEKSFEEALEEQKKRSLEEEMQQKQEKGKKDKEKKFKKWNKRKEKNESQEPEKVEIPIHDSQTNELVGEIEIIEPREVHPRRKGKSSSKSSVSKSESSPSSEETDGLDHHAKPCGDVKVATVEKRKVEKPPVKEKDERKAEVKEKEAPKAQISEPQSFTAVNEALQIAPEVSSAATPTKKKKKDVADKTTDFSGFTVSKLVQFLKEAELGDEESQMLIDVLLNKQKDASEWKKKNDPLATVKKQLQEKEQALEVEQNQRQVATAKLKEIKQEYAQEKTRATAQEKQLQEKVNQQAQEIKSLTQRIKQVQEQMNGEKSSHQEKIQELQSSLDEKHETAVKAFQEEKAQLQKTVAKLETSARSRPSISEYETKLENLQKSRDELQKVHSLLIEQHTLLISSHKSESDKLNAQLSEAKRMMNEADEKQRSVTEEVEALRKSCENLESSNFALEQQLNSLGNDKIELQNLQVQLSEAQEKCRDIETQNFHLSDHISELTQLNNSQISQLQHLAQENERLSLELKSAIATNEMQNTAHQNGDINEKENEILQKSLAEKEIILEEKEKQLQQVQEELQKQRSQATILSSDLEVQKQKNNELREKNWKAMDALSAAEKSAEQKVQEAHQASSEKLLQLQQELERQIKLVDAKNSLEESCEKLSQKLRKAEENLLSYQSDAEEKLNIFQSESEERIKHLNFELQRVQNLLKSAESRVSEIEVTAEELRAEILKTQNNTKKCLQRIFPNVTVDNSVPHDVWLLQFEEQALAALKALTHSSQVDELLAKISDMEQEKADLIEAVNHYKTVLADTEIVLNRLQHSAESTESVWKDKLNLKDQELAAALKEKQDLISEKEKLQSTIDQMGRLDEMQEKLKLLQDTIESAENERAHLQLKYEEVNNNYINLQDQIKSKEQRILELQKDLSSFEDIQKELKEVKLKLEKEAKINKDLSAQTVKLSSLVKIGQDSLKAEQDQVSQLRSQLEAYKSQSCTATANGTSSPNLAVTENEDSSVKK